MSSTISHSVIAMPLPALDRPTMDSLLGLVERGVFPVTIFTMLQQMGGFALGGALVLVGCSCDRLKEIQFRHPLDGYDSETRGIEARWIGDRYDFQVGLEFPVNGKRGEDWRMAVSYDANDTYSVAIWAANGRSGTAYSINHVTDVYGDDLLNVVDSVYTEAMNTHNDGFIPLD